MNRLEATITNVISSGGVILADLSAKDYALSALLVDSVENPPWIRKNHGVYILFKETEVSIAKNFSGLISMRNQLPCVITNIECGQLMSIIHLNFKGLPIISSITTRSVNSLQLVVGDEVIAMIKANELALMQK